MKLLFTRLTVILLFSITLVSAKSGLENSQPLYKGSAYKAGTLIINVKSVYRSQCSENAIAIPALQKAFQEISFSGVKKKFPNHSEPTEKFNKRGQTMVDLSLIYEVSFSPIIKIEEAMQLIALSGVVEYAEPLYKHNFDFTPNDPSIGSQYALGKINAYNAWDVWKGDSNVVIGIVDSGTDWDHPDLAANIKQNYGDPIDNIDNDNDGFIDNFRGWDMSENDNDPMVASSWHGSHVSGCANAVTDNSTGVAGPAFNCKFLPIKTSLDNSQLIDNGWEGIIYAADHEAKVINCSWGRTGSPSQMEQTSVNYATINKDALIVAAAGNDGAEGTHYPASYENVISVAATSVNDGKANFSNYDQSVDVCAPGVNIYATYFNDTYANMDGTSMASPIAAGCAAMIRSRWPSLTALQAGEQLRTTCDNIYSSGSNALFTGKLGKGRVNLFKAMTDSLSPGVIMKKATASDNDDEVFMPGDTVTITGLFENLLRPTTNLTCSLVTASTFVTILQNNFTAGVLNTFDTVSNYNSVYRVAIKPTAPLNTEVTFRVFLTDGTWSDVFICKIIVNVDYVNIAINNVGTSITSRGLIGYNQTGQLQGLGFTYMGGPSILYDMGLMIGATGTQVSDQVRGATGNDDDFFSVSNVVAHEPGAVSDFDVNGTFNDNGSTSVAPLNLIVDHSAYAWIAAPNDNYVMVRYLIRNSGTITLNNLSVGLFADWDIPAYANNKCSTDNTNRMGYIWSTDAAGLYGGMKLLSHTGTFNHYALDNTAANGGIDMTDGFDNTEKYTALSTSRLDAGTASATGNDVLSVVSANGFTLAPGATIEVAFALLAGQNLTEIQTAAGAAQTMYDNQFNGLNPIGNSDKNELYPSFPNPADKEVNIGFSLIENTQASLCIYNVLGVKVKTLVNEKLHAGNYTIHSDIRDLPSGNYFYRIESGVFTKTLPLVIQH